MVKKRDYQQERKTLLARGEREGHRLRLQARRDLEKKGLVHAHDGKDIDHKIALSQGGGNTKGNLRVQTVHDNRSFNRTKTGAIKKRKK